MSKSPEGTRFTLSGELAGSLKDVSERHDMKVGEALKHAIVMLKFLEDQELAGNNLYIQDPEANTITPLHFGHNNFHLWEDELKN